MMRPTAFKLASNLCSVAAPKVGQHARAMSGVSSAFKSDLQTCYCISCMLGNLGTNKRNMSNFTTFGTTDLQNQSPHVRNILENNQKWVKSVNQEDPNFFKELAKGQKPKYLYFGCSDSRVPANQIMGLGPGEVFVHRNIGNQVPGNDLNALSVLEYAVGHLGVTDIIVTGHYECGAVRAATTRQDLGTLENWLRLIRDVYRLNREQLDSIKDENDKHRALVELNVIEQCLNVYKTGVVQRTRNTIRKKLMDSGKKESELGDDVFPRIHGFVFNPADGRLKRIPVDFQKRIGSLDSIYGLYPN